jgi:hypothetical protein
LRTIAFAYKDLVEGEGGPEHDEKEDGAKLANIELSGLTLISIAGIKDIIREEVPDAVATCAIAGVRVRWLPVTTKSLLLPLPKSAVLLLTRKKSIKNAFAWKALNSMSMLDHLFTRRPKKNPCDGSR